MKKLKRGDIVKLTTNRPSYLARFLNCQGRWRPFKGQRLVVCWVDSDGDVVVRVTGSAPFQTVQRGDLQFVRRPRTLK